jgi:Arc/MetJ-type ribon-helix-helix transcriptional regulator
MSTVVTRQSKKIRMKSMTIRVPEHIIEHFRDNYSNGSKKVREVLQAFIQKQGAKSEKAKVKT